MTDDRRRFDNLSGQRGPLGFEQDEIADAAGAYLQNEFALTDAVNLQADLRYDHVRYEVDDRFASNVAAEGEHLPGVPRHYAWFELDYQHSSGLYVKWDWAHVGSVYADNLDLTRVDGYGVSNLVFGRDFRFGPSR